MAGRGISLNPQETADLRILASLEPDQLTGAKLQGLPRRHLKASEILLLWSLRVYLLLMIGVVVYQVFGKAQ
jgi:hypothetical protein